ncbi:DNA-processing protein DprA [Acidovorax sp. SRB_24]|uniref:DNA-processing protein DprA n=1 Tax=Acidovorax sp. SRB_24 TaxID=1962700 RepID=UPI00145E58C6|nr:DNA-processing protein DprA [Acidovorax sp. SRB_24]NMM77208.1 DNA protecting protein DprA [Acidovorax sp. SRB_24]
MERDELAAWLRLTLTPGVGDAAARRLLGTFGLPQRIFGQSGQALQQCVTPAQAHALLREPDGLPALVETTWQWLHTAPAAGPARAIVALGDPRYPRLLLETQDPPLLLYLLGPDRFIGPQGTPFPTHHCLAMVGSRNPTAQGQENARQFARALRASGLVIVSGLALGVDAAAHEGALEASTDADPMPATVAVVGTGLDRVYPRRHLDLAHRIAARGVLVSEYPLGTAPLPGNFPKRNRIIAGLSLGTLVVEAATASGSLITARLAAEQGREVFAIPGSIHAPQSRGCHALLRQGAKLVESAQDVLEELRLAPPPPAAEACPLPEEVQEPDSPLLRALGFDPVGLDALQARTGLDTATLQVQLLDLELAGVVARLPGALFQRLARA